MTSSCCTLRYFEDRPASFVYNYHLFTYNSSKQKMSVWCVAGTKEYIWDFLWHAKFSLDW